MESSKLSEHVIREWADEQGLPNLSFAELDYRLARAIGAIYQDDFLKSRLIMKGGTAINKFLLKETSRLSVDLDFNQIGRKEQVLKERRSIRERIVTLLKEQDTRCDIHFKRAYEQTTIKARYRTVLGNTQQFKVEISHIERFAILEPVD